MSSRPESRPAATDKMNNTVPTSSLPSVLRCAVSLAIKHSLMFRLCVLRARWGACVPIAVLGLCVLRVEVGLSVSQLQYWGIVGWGGGLHVSQLQCWGIVC